MAMDAETRKKLQFALLLGIAIAGARAAYIVYQRHEAKQDEAKIEAKIKIDAPLQADYYVTPKKLRPYDLKTARELTRQPAWVKLGYYHTYYPYNLAAHKTDFAHEAGTLGPLQKLEIKDVVTEPAPKAAGTRQILAIFRLDGPSDGESDGSQNAKTFAVPIGAEKGSDFQCYSDNIFFIEDPRDLYKHWPADVWKAVDEHRVQAGMNELQASFALGMGTSEGSGDYGSRTLNYPNGGKPVTVTFENDKAVAIKAETS